MTFCGARQKKRRNPSSAVSSGPTVPIFDFERLVALLKESGAATCHAGWSHVLDVHADLIKSRFSHSKMPTVQTVRGGHCEASAAPAPDAQIGKADQADLSEDLPEKMILPTADSDARLNQDSLNGAGGDNRGDAAEFLDATDDFEFSPKYGTLGPLSSRIPERLPMVTLDLDTVGDNEAQRLKRLVALYEDPRLNLRPLLIPDDEMIARIETLRGTLASSCKPVIDAVLGAARLSQRTRTGFRVAPVLLVGPPGCGKTHLMEALAKALDMPITRISAPSMTDSGMWLGHPVSWKTPKTGMLTTALIEHGASLCLIDEIDKAYQHDVSDSPLNPLLGLLERSSQTKVKDEFLELEFDHSQTMFVACANSLDGLSAPLLDRFLVIRLEEPDQAQSTFVARRIILERLGVYGGVILMPNDDVVERLAAFPTRQMSRLLDLALGVMASAGRDRLVTADIEAVEAIFEKGKTTIEIGFPRRFP